MALALEHTTFLGRATVQKVDGRLLQLDVGEHYQWAELALCFPYEPAPGDEVLAIGQEENWYVLGVLKGTGRTSFTVPADLRIRAPRGVVELAAGKGIRLKSPSVKIMADKLKTMARTVFEHFTEATRWVKEAFLERFGSLRTRVQTSYDLKAETINERAEGAVRIDGKKIHLG